MSSRIAFLCAALCLCSAAAFAQGPKPGTVGFRGKSYEATALPEEVGAAAKAAVREWAPWAKTHGYRLDLDPSRRVLLISTKSNVDASLGLVTKTIALFDGLFPASLKPVAPETSAPAGPAKTASPADGDVIPEDPETPPPGAPEVLPPEKNEVLEVTRQTSNFVPDSKTAVMLVIKNSADYDSALDQLVAARSYLGPWKSTASSQIGFALEDPLCGAYNENSPGQEEWNPDNELVHRTMALLVLRRFSEQPYWLYTGLCWYGELSIAKSIYCMPYRDSFVGIGEHGGWLAALNSLYSGRAKLPLEMQEFKLVRGKWDDRLAKTSLGMVDFLCKQNPRALSGLMEELRRYRDLHGRQTDADGTWTKILDYEVPAEQQKILLERYYGANVLRDAISYWTSGAIEPAK
ncbi:MAG: hypothetical protein ABI054_09670 [Planctomycetota bacterium]